MKITLVGTGCGTSATLTEEGLRAFREADVIFGAARVLEGLPDFNEPDGTKAENEYRKKKTIEAKPGQICRLLENYYEDENTSNAAIALSGDSGFYSGARLLKKKITERLEEMKKSGAVDDSDQIDPVEIVVIPGISSVQMLAAKLGIPWQDWRLVSAHGTDCDPVLEIMKGKATFFLTGGRYKAEVICRELKDAGLGGLKVTVGENLSYEEAGPNDQSGDTGSGKNGNARNRKERIFVGSAEQCANMIFSDLSVLLVEPEAVGQSKGSLILPKRNPGIPDAEFIRGKVPMTKSEIRSVILSRMNVSETDIVWDIGAGTGSVSVELAMQAGQVWALEKKDEAIDLIYRNRHKFGRWNLHVVQGNAPEDMDRMPSPDKVFVGGSGRHLKEILQKVWERNEAARICISATLLETLQEGMEAFAERKVKTDIVQIAVTRAEVIGERHIMKAGNPIYILTGEKDDIR